MSRLTLQQAMYRAAQLQVSGRVQEAEQICRQVLEASPKHAAALHLMGVIAVNSGRGAQAVELIERAIALEPYEGYFHYNLGLAYFSLGRFDRAAEAFRQAIVYRPNLAEAHSNLAASLLAMRKFDETIEGCKQAILMHADSPQVYNAMGVALKNKGQLDEAVGAFQQALAIQPDFYESLSNLAHVLRIQGKLEESIDIYRRAISSHPDRAELHNDLAGTLDDDDQIDAAIGEFNRAIELRPNFASAECSLASSLHRAARFEEAMAASRAAIAHAGDPALPKFNLSLMLLLQGRFEEGWPLLESRWDVKKFRGPTLDLGKPKWDGSDLAGRTILLHGEQGFGDTIQFARYLPLVRQRGGRIILGAQPELVRLLRSMEEADQVLAEAAPASLGFDVYCSLLSLPLLFKTTLQTIPASVPYLRADPQLAADWRKRVPEGQLKVGLAWAGRATHPRDSDRSLGLAGFAKLAETGNVWFCGLQKGEAASQIQTLPPGFEVIDFSSEMNDFSDTAALIENLDLVITVDTAAAHLAGAMGKPVWLLLPFVPDWRWMLGRNDSPWYPTMKLFRQAKMGDWQTVIESVKHELTNQTSRHNQIA